LPSFQTVQRSEIPNASPCRITMPTISCSGTHERTQVLIPMWGSMMAFFGPSGGTWALSGSSFSCVPQPISAGAVPSSSRPSMHQVPTNSSTFFGIREICVSRSEQWITLDPDFHGKFAKALLFYELFETFRVCCEIVCDHPVCDIDKALLGHVRDKPRVCPVVDHAGSRTLPVFGELPRSFICR